MFQGIFATFVIVCLMILNKLCCHPYHFRGHFHWLAEKKKKKTHLLFLHTRSIPLFVSDNHIYSGWLNST